MTVVFISVGYFGNPKFNFNTAFFTSDASGHLIQQLNPGLQISMKAYLWLVLTPGVVIAFIAVVALGLFLNYLKTVDHLNSGGRYDTVGDEIGSDMAAQASWHDLMSAFWGHMQARNMSIDVLVTDMWTTSMVLTGLLIENGLRAWEEVMFFAAVVMGMYMLVFATDLVQSSNISEPIAYRKRRKGEMPVLQKAFPKFFTNRAGPALLGIVYTWVLVWITVKISIFAGKMPTNYSAYGIFVTMNVLLVIFEWVKWFVRISYLSYTSVPVRRFFARMLGMDDEEFYRGLLARKNVEDPSGHMPIDSRREYMNIYARDTIVTLMNGFQIVVFVYGTMGGYGMQYPTIPQFA